MIFKKSGRLPNNTGFNFDNVENEIVKNSIKGYFSNEQIPS